MTTLQAADFLVTAITSLPTEERAQLLTELIAKLVKADTLSFYVIERAILGSKKLLIAKQQEEARIAQDSQGRLAMQKRTHNTAYPE